MNESIKTSLRDTHYIKSTQVRQGCIYSSTKSKKKIVYTGQMNLAHFLQHLSTIFTQYKGELLILHWIKTCTVKMFNWDEIPFRVRKITTCSFFHLPAPLLFSSIANENTFSSISTIVCRKMSTKFIRRFAYFQICIRILFSLTISTNERNKKTFEMNLAPRARSCNYVKTNAASFKSE